MQGHSAFSSENYLIFVRNVLLKPIPSSSQGNIVIIKYIKGYLSSVTMLLLPREICAAVKCFISHQNQSCASRQDSSDTLFPCPCLFVNCNCSFPLRHLHGCVVVGSRLEYKFHSLVLCFQPSENPAYLISVFCHSSGRKALCITI